MWFPASTIWAKEKVIRRSDRRIPNSYLVVLSSDIVDEVEVIIEEIAQRHKVKAKGVYKRVLKGASFEMTEMQAEAILRDARVDHVTEDAEIPLAYVQTPRNWNLDRSDNRISPRLDQSYSYCSTGRGVRAYVVDTGIWAAHDEFSNPDPLTGNPRVDIGKDYITPSTPSANNPCGSVKDPNNYAGSHGTAVASALAGRTLGVAKEAVLVPVRTGDCLSGSVKLTQTVAGLEWIPTDPGYVNGMGRVVNCSWEVNDTASTAVGTHDLELALRSLVNLGITVVVAAGNQNQDIGTTIVPARDATFIVAGGTKGRNSTDLDERWNDGGLSGYSGSNYGPTIDLFAPADRVLVAHWSSTTATRDPENNTYSSGTSFATPLVAGAAARFLEFYPGETSSQIEARLIGNATTEAHGLNIIDRRTSPNRLLYMPSDCKRRACCG